ncbi:hypothetical protein DL767_000054 [Monosporascus sp. MG133]|nr:hypothetical protein DL767_000054 [Monosporascus sp. MG133]
MRPQQPLRTYLCAKSPSAIYGIEPEPLGRDRQGPGPAPGPERGSAQESTASPAAPARPQTQGFGSRQRAQPSRSSSSSASAQSLHDHGDADAALRNMEVVHQWVFAAQTWLSGPLEKDRLNIAGQQIYCLTILARQIFSVDGDLVWLSKGSLVNEAMQMGLYRDPECLPAVPVLQAELRRRLWATIVDRTGLGKYMSAVCSFFWRHWDDRGRCGRRTGTVSGHTEGAPADRGSW